jgi:hypothetical protein
MKYFENRNFIGTMNSKIINDLYKEMSKSYYKNGILKINFNRINILKKYGNKLYYRK